MILMNLSEIRPYDKNPRKNDGKAVDKVAMSIKEFGFNVPIVIDSENVILAGHTRYKAAQKLKLTIVPVLKVNLSKERANAYRLADNRVAQESEWDVGLLKIELEGLNDASFDLDLTGFDAEELENLLAEEVPAVEEDENVDLEPQEDAVAKPGDIFLLGDHRVMCGDSTVLTDVEKLMDGKLSTLLHADPPYGMGKENEGVLNDNLYKEKLDSFQLDWFSCFITALEKNASIYIWGNSEDLWRLWLKTGLSEWQNLNLVQEIVWAKVRSQENNLSDAIGQASDGMRSYPIASERCLFLKRGHNSLNVNSDNYWEGWEDIRLYLVEESEKMGWGQKEVHTITNTQMYPRWFSKSQWNFIPEDKYNLLRESANKKAFACTWDYLNQLYQKAKKIYEGTVLSEHLESLAYFDNTHDIMSDVWTSTRVRGEERHGHATPKPLDLMERAIKTSSKKGDIVVEPFGGTGTTLIACETTGRICYTMELEPRYVDVIVKRWEKLTGKTAELLIENGV